MEAHGSLLRPAQAPPSDTAPRGRHRSPAADTDMPVSTHRPYFAKLALGSFSVFKWRPCASRPAVRHRSPTADSSAAVRHSPSAADTVYLAPAATALGAGRHGTWRRPTRHLAPADSHTQPRPTRPPRRPTHRGRHRPCPDKTTKVDDTVWPTMNCYV